jgi:multiple sugar transport system substrate-binding protein
MKRRVALMAVAASFALFAAACTAGGGTDEPPPSVDPNAEHDPVTLEMWIPFSADHEVAGVQATFDAFEAEYPWITMKVTTGVEDDAKVLAAIRAGTPPDATMSWALDDLAAFCDTGAWQDLTPYIEQDGMDLSSVFPPSVERYTGFGGKRCAFPFLTDAVGLYYNKDLLEAKGYSEPPKTYSELTAMAKDLTEFNADGSIKVAGFVPWFGNYYVNGDPLNHSIAWDADWYTDDGKAAMASDPDWAAMFRWQKDLVDFYGVDNLKKFVAGQGDEWGESSQDFQQGRIAMALDGEWRTAFIENGTPDLNYGTAPAPVPDDKQDLYGIGRVGGTIIGIPRGSAHEAEAWLLVKFMATNTDSLVAAANAIGNVPTTFESLESPDL